MATERHLTAVPEPGTDSTVSTGGRASSVVPSAEALASFRRHLANRRGRSGRFTSPETVRAYTSAVAIAFTGIGHLGELTGGGRERLHTNIHTA